ncbi:hypothetical protein FDP41_005881 [Naegleria fowleri]|uniref:Vacuolar fusion protein MON1 homolog n=1 Tax=Naegleria fowleri TaxID=5763 RepID=A0A6A5BLW5_NAEFO|nr:uncharacterized protein FDP41_005881 [Naegleria fowleri]KAF0975128.1 hypothetical protein FDP41_005881 [Naegleria fowleri]CAG4718325.1 unnamed protein product [Naegleria fowleri]
MSSSSNGRDSSQEPSASQQASTSSTTSTPIQIINSPPMDEGDDDDYAFSVVSRHGSISENNKLDSPTNFQNTSQDQAFLTTTRNPETIREDDEEAAAFSQIIYNEEDSTATSEDPYAVNGAIKPELNDEEKDLQTGVSRSEGLSESSSTTDAVEDENNDEGSNYKTSSPKTPFSKNELISMESSNSSSPASVDFPISSIIINNSKYSDSNANITIIREEKPKYMKHSDEDQTQERWKQHQKHIFILSEAGKPIFSRYGDENQLNTIMSFFLGIVSIVSKEGGTVRTVNCGKLRFIYVLKGSLYLVSACRTSESNKEIAKQLETIYEQLVFILTSKNIQDILQKRSNFDLRNLLGGTDKIIYSLINRMSNSFDFSFDTTHVLRLPKSLRGQIGDIMMKNRVQTKLMFSLMICDNMLIHMIRNKKYNMQTKDLLLLMNFVGSAHSSMKSSETWTPICLPGLSETQYVYGYIYYFTENWCYVMICTSTESFFDCQESQTHTVQDLLQTECFPTVVNASKSPYPTLPEIFNQKSPLLQSPPVTIDDPSLPQSYVRHFSCRIKSTGQSFSQTISSKFAPPYHTKKERKRLLRLYKLTREKLEEIPQKSIGSQVRTYVGTTPYESIMGLWSGNLEIYASFSLLTSKTDMLNACEVIKAWVKKEENSLFIPNIQTF